ncbi:MAG: NUDIX hydrolase [Proteobacteria bacterium]|nr:MAG: NUDIX hydrolase [Pseudomonadota bacterium]
MTRPVTPRHAASLLIHRQGRFGTEVFMGRRHKKARFKPDVYVFPGGMVERSDHSVRAASGLDPAATAKLAVAGSPRRAQALAIAAVRETFEETGLLLGACGTIGPSTDPTWSVFRERGLAPDLSRIGYLGRAITPSIQPLRFHARFFFVSAEHVQGEIAPSEELEDLRWVPLLRRSSLRMMQITELMLDTLGRRLSGEISKSPFVSFHHGRQLTVWQ